MRSFGLDCLLLGLVASALGLPVAGCSNSPDANNGTSPSASGGNATTQSAGGATANGGATAQGGVSSKGGAATGNGGSSNASTAATNGGTQAQGGSYSQGGSAATLGGASNRGGTTNSGATSNVGGKAVGGASNAGGASSGGTNDTGKTGGASAGGASASSATNAGGSIAGGATNVGGSSAGGASVGGGTSSGGASSGGASAAGTSNGGGSASAWKGAVCTTMGTTAIDTAFKTGFEKWKTDYVVECGTNLARVKGCQGDNSTCSEAIGYGMLVAVAAGNQALLDKFNGFRKALQAVNNAPDTTSGKLMAWLSGDTCPPTASGGNSNSATDGDLDAAMALIQANQRWPGAAYLTEAKQYIEAIWLNQVEKDGSGNPTRLKAGNLALAQDTRDYISYYAPGYFHAFAAITGAAKWSKLADVFYTKLADQQSKCADGQVPDTFGATECKIWYDSCRAPWRIATDYGWFGDERAKAFLDKLRAGKVANSDPSAATDQNNSALIGAFAMSGVSSDDATMQKMCNAWEGKESKDDAHYFQYTLRLLFMSVAAGTPQSGAP